MKPPTNLVMTSFTTRNEERKQLLQRWGRSSETRREREETRRRRMTPGIKDGLYKRIHVKSKKHFPLFHDGLQGIHLRSQRSLVLLHLTQCRKFLSFCKKHAKRGSAVFLLPSRVCDAEKIESHARHQNSALAFLSFSSLYSSRLIRWRSARA